MLGRQDTLDAGETCFHRKLVLGAVKGWTITLQDRLDQFQQGTWRRIREGGNIDSTRCREPGGLATQEKTRLAFARTEIAFFSRSHAFRTGRLGVFPWWESGAFGVQGHLKRLRAG